MKGIRFGKIHSFDDLHLVLSTVNIPPAKPKTTFIDLPGADGSVDLTEALGRVKYSNREASFTFTVLPSQNFEQVKRSVCAKINGSRMKILVEKDPDYFWNGRCYVDEYNSDAALNQIVVAAILDPHKLKETETFSFSSSTDEKNADFYIKGDFPVTLEWQFTKETSIKIGTDLQKFSPGKYRMYDIEPGTLNFTYSSDGGFTVSYQERAL